MPTPFPASHLSAAHPAQAPQCGTREWPAAHPAVLLFPPQFRSSSQLLWTKSSFSAHTVVFLDHTQKPKSYLKWSQVKWSRSVVSNSFDPVDGSPPGSSVHGILQARILEWAAISFSKVINECLFIKWMIAAIVLTGPHHGCDKVSFDWKRSFQWLDFFWVTSTLLMQIGHSLTFSQTQITICFESDRLKKYNREGKLSLISAMRPELSKCLSEGNMNCKQPLSPSLTEEPTCDTGQLSCVFFSYMWSGHIC